MSQAIEAAKTSVVVGDRSHWGRILVSDADRLRFLHNQTTNSFQQRQPGEGCDTVFVNSTGRTLDLATAYVLNDAVLLLVSPGQQESLIQWMDRYIFFADEVKLQDITAATAAFSLVGPGSDTVIQSLGAGELIGQPYGTHHLFFIDGTEVRIAVGSGLALPGYTLILDADQKLEIWDRLIGLGAASLNAADWEILRVEQGRPMPGQELTEDFNPLEAGLWNTISLTKGCYIGQETIARLHTYRGVKQQLWGIRLDAAVPLDSPVMIGDERVGKLTSCVPDGDRYLGLAYIRTKAIESEVRRVQIQGVEGELVPVPFVSHEYI